MNNNEQMRKAITTKCAGCGRTIEVLYDEYVEIGPARYCPRCFAERTESEANGEQK